MSPIFDIGPSLYFMINNFFLEIYSLFHKMKTRTKIEFLGHRSLLMNPRNK